MLVVGAAITGGSTLAALQLALPKLWLAGVSFGGVVVGVLAVAMVHPVWVAIEERSLAKLPFRFKVGKYLKALGKGRKQTKLRLTARFAQTLSPDAKAKILERVGSASGGTSPKFSGSELLVRATLDTYANIRSVSDDTDRYRNHKVHALVRRVLRSLSAIHGQHPVEGVEVSLTSAD
ncbi:hypothetical protein ENSA5_61600 [Enhygromyxa salina]|uniref:Uncharacterized protein n=2 Tax=Enhygromyxa salina TaxID=215803 RepID=A0A2S9XCZ1_9BACT|nr:hypothetical protein ENSA5_61600 [Enhygromyxa salina]